MGTALGYSASTAATGVRVGLSHHHTDITMLKLVVLRQRLPRQPHDTLSGKSYWRNQKFFDTQNFGERSDLTCLEKRSNSGFSGMCHCVGPSVGLRFVGFLSILGSCDRVHICTFRNVRLVATSPIHGYLGPPNSGLAASDDRRVTWNSF